MKPDTVSITTSAHGLGGLGTVCIFGTGDFGRSLGLRLLQAGYEVVFGSRDSKTSTPLEDFHPGPKVMSHAEAAKEAQVVFVAVQREHYDFLTPLIPVLQGKVLVDVSNNLKKGLYQESNAEYLSSLVPGAVVVKAFNTISAWALQSGGLDANRQVYVCGDQPDAKRAVEAIAQNLGLTALDRGSLRAARELEDLPLELFPLWRLPLGIATGLTAFFFFYLLIRDVIYAYVNDGRDISFRIMITLANKVFPIVSLVMLALCYLPGILAAFVQLYNGTKYRRFPDWLDRWMRCRKQIGLLALGCALLHVLYTCIISIRYYVQYKNNAELIGLIKENTNLTLDNAEAWATDSFFALGVLGFLMYVLLGITSIPSVGSSLNWREFRFVQSKIGFLTLMLCTGHCLLYAWNKFLKPTTYKWYTPPGSMLSLVVPCSVLVLKLIIILPCVNRPISRIRQGWERKRKSVSQQRF
ncbi:metalloreductase STEAP4-like [Chanos chanos]|uniref:Metalloreductase STEAP4-like n=1 Tax=Chanos chanos TaxID=29144 RepID=A0A6J2WAM4_CHACN|nr:metalloreductase STEAP4-like [Chanos chanos]